MCKARAPLLFMLTAVLTFAGGGRLPSSAMADAQTYVLQGSTTFTRHIMEPYGAAIERSCGHNLVVKPTKSSEGLLALFKRSADFAMISGPLNNEIKVLKTQNPDLSYERLQTFTITATRVAFAVNRDNPVQQITEHDLRRVLLGEIVNWSDLGGPDLPIRVVMVGGGGGVAISVEAKLLDGAPIKAKNPVTLQVSSEVLKITQLIPGALAISQLGLVRKADVAEVKTEHLIEQPLDLVTLGPPNPEMRNVINAARDIMRNASH